MFGWLMRWVVKLGEYELMYQPRPTIKGQVLLAGLGLKKSLGGFSFSFPQWLSADNRTMLIGIWN